MLGWRSTDSPTRPEFTLIRECNEKPSPQTPLISVRNQLMLGWRYTASPTIPEFTLIRECTISEGHHTSFYGIPSQLMWLCWGDKDNLTNLTEKVDYNLYNWNKKI